MKTLMRFSIASLFFSFALLLLSCNSGSDSEDFNNRYYEDLEINTPREADYELTSRIWKIANVNVSTINPDFSNYKLVFNPNNSLIATYGDISYSGTWSITDDNPNQKLLSDLKLNLVFSTPTIFNQMSKKWTFNLITFDYNNGDEIDFIYINNGVQAGSFRLFEIK